MLVHEFLFIGKENSTEQKRIVNTRTFHAYIGLSATEVEQTAGVFGTHAELEHDNWIPAIGSNRFEVTINSNNL